MCGILAIVVTFVLAAVCGSLSRLTGAAGAVIVLSKARRKAAMGPLRSAPPLLALVGLALTGGPTCAED